MGWERSGENKDAPLLPSPLAPAAALFPPSPPWDFLLGGCAPQTPRGVPAPPLDSGSGGRNVVRQAHHAGGRPAQSDGSTGSSRAGGGQPRGLPLRLRSMRAGPRPPGVGRQRMWAQIGRGAEREVSRHGIRSWPFDRLRANGRGEARGHPASAPSTCRPEQSQNSHVDSCTSDVYRTSLRV